MSKIRKIHSYEWQIVDGILSVVITGRDSLRREAIVAVPAAAIVSTIASDARRRLAANMKEGKHDSTPGTWNQVGFLQAQGIEVGITDENEVGLVLDPGMETEFALSIEPRLARELGKRIREIADMATGKDPTLN
jgi:hypothetical protein